MVGGVGVRTARASGRGRDSGSTKAPIAGLPERMSPAASWAPTWRGRRKRGKRKRGKRRSGRREGATRESRTAVGVAREGSEPGTSAPARVGREVGGQEDPNRMVNAGSVGCGTGAPPPGAPADGLTTTRAPFIEGARSRGDLFITQPYELYSEENHQSWRNLYARMQERWERYANHRFLEGLGSLGLNGDRIPRLEEVNRFLAPLTGFEARPVSGYVPAYLFFDCLGRREFPTTITIRDVATPDYLPEPDIFHDIAGHVPMHTDPAFAETLVRFGQVSKRRWSAWRSWRIRRPWRSGWPAPCGPWPGSSGSPSSSGSCGTAAPRGAAGDTAGNGDRDTGVRGRLRGEGVRVYGSPELPRRDRPRGGEPPGAALPLPVGVGGEPGLPYRPVPAPPLRGGLLRPPLPGGESAGGVDAGGPLDHVAPGEPVISQEEIRISLEAVRGV
jgi:hypothetical protein